MSKITNSYSGKQSFIKGAGRSGKKSLDEYQRILIHQERLNMLDNKGISQERYSEFFTDGI